jgi:hypothetical protein
MVRATSRSAPGFSRTSSGNPIEETCGSGLFLNLELDLLDLLLIEKQIRVVDLHPILFAPRRSAEALR